MSVSIMCRVCLQNDLNLYGVRNDLRNAFEKITTQKYNKVGYPLSMCYICLSVLQKCHRFMETARDTNNVLKQWYKQQNEMEVAQPLYIYSVSQIEFVSIANEDVPLQQDIKTEDINLEPDNVEYNTDLGIEKTDIDEQTDTTDPSGDSPNDSAYSDAKEDNSDLETNPLFDSQMDIEETSSSASNLEVHANVEAKLEVTSAPDDGARPIKKRQTKETKRQHQAPNTSGQTAGNNGTANDITYLNTYSSQRDSIICRETKLEPTFSNKSTNKQTPKLNKSRKTYNAIQRKRNEYFCDMCNFKTTYGKSKLIRHIIIHTGEKPFSCTVCSFRCAMKGSLTRHMRLHTGENQFRSFFCDICGYTCATKAHLKSHFVTHTIEKPYSCNYCSYRCVRKHDLKSHMMKHTGNKPYICDICSKSFAHRSTLNNHMKIHTGEKPFSCDVCSYKCAFKNQLNIHMKTHTGEKPFSCNICDKIFAHSWNLKAHMRTHTGKKTFICDVCDSKFSKKRDLVNHKSTHTGFQPFSCDISGNKVAQKDNLMKHLQSQNNYKPISCNMCSYKCSQISHLTEHKRIHTGEKPFSCDICNRKFSLKQALKRHKRTHTGEKPYSCDICSYKCTQICNLKAHMRTHTGEKPYSCDICDCEFVRSHHLKTHKVAKHSTNK